MDAGFFSESPEYVEFYFDGGLLSTACFAPYDFNGPGGASDTLTIPDGFYTIEAHAYGVAEHLVLKLLLLK